jgi:phage repressor protein C with HTH and peptisase S24 domain
MSDDRPDAAKRLEQARIARGFDTAKDAARFFGWPYITYAQHESGERGLTRAASKYAQGLRVSEGWLLLGEGQGPDGEIIAPPKPVVQLVPGADLVSRQKMPVYAAAQGGDGHIIVSFEQIDEVKRPAELENVKGGYGLLIKGVSMVPALWEGDMALVNPHLPPARQKNVILYHTPPNGGEVEAIVKQLNNWTDREWFLQQYNPPLEFKEYRQEWPICHRVVGKYDGR